MWHLKIFFSRTKHSQTRKKYQPRKGSAQFQAMFSFQKFSRFPITSNVWTHIWSIKCRRKKLITQFSRKPRNESFELISPWLTLIDKYKRKCYSSLSQKFSRTKCTLSQCINQPRKGSAQFQSMQILATWLTMPYARFFTLQTWPCIECHGKLHPSSPTASSPHRC
jgi:hypothetical protein